LIASTLTVGGPGGVLSVACACGSKVCGRLLANEQACVD
jgi:hypothetical protein